jgi:hypothetical protein
MDGELQVLAGESLRENSLGVSGKKVNFNAVRQHRLHSAITVNIYFIFLTRV